MSASESLPLIEAGVRLTCVDRSTEMLAVLRGKLEQRQLVAEVCQMDVRELSLPRQYSLALILFHSLADLVSPEDRCQTLQPDGVHVMFRVLPAFGVKGQQPARE